jgi:hypothetical protein
MINGIPSISYTTQFYTMPSATGNYKLNEVTYTLELYTSTGSIEKTVISNVSRSLIDFMI